MLKKALRESKNIVRSVKKACSANGCGTWLVPVICVHMFWLYKYRGIPWKIYLKLNLVADLPNLRDPSVKRRYETKLRSYIRREENVDFIETVNDIYGLRIIRDKLEIMRRLVDYTGREYLDLNQTSLAEFCAFVKKHGAFVAKDPTGSYGRNINVVRDVATDEEAERWYHELLKNKNTLVEEMLIQHPKLNCISPTGVACMRIHTLNVGKEAFTVLPIFIQCTQKKSQVSNGGISLELDDQTGVSLGEEWGLEYHPETGEPLKGFIIPFVQEAKQLVCQAAMKIPEVSFIGWDVAITPTGPVIIEGNGASRAYTTLYRFAVQHGNYNLRQEYAAIIDTLRFYNSGADVSSITERVFDCLPPAEKMPNAVAILGSRKCGYRVDRAIEYLRGLPSIPLVIVSGGNICGEDGYDLMTEAAYIRKRLLDAGIPEQKIICEEQSKNTEQNAENIISIVHEHLRNCENPVLSIVTGGFHMLRTLKDFTPKLLPGEQLQAVPAYGKHTRPDNWYKNYMGISLVMNELRTLGIAIPDDDWRTNNPNDILLNRPKLNYAQVLEDNSRGISRRKNPVKGVLLFCSTGNDTHMPSHYRVLADGTILQRYPENRVPSGIGKEIQDEWKDQYLWVELEVSGLQESSVEAFTPDFFQTQVWRSFGYTAELCSYLCKKYRMNPEKKGVLVSLEEAYADAQIEGNGSPESIWTPYKLGMSDLRITVGRIIKDDRKKRN